MHEADRPIALLDSGVGGLPYLAAAREELPMESFIYLADREGYPYGTKPREEVRDRVIALVAALLSSYRPKVVVIACNTASQAALKGAREAFPHLHIVGTVPAVKPAAESTRTGVIGVLATEGAVEDPYLDELIRSCAGGVTVLREAAQELVDFVERRSVFASAEERLAVVEPFVRKLVDGGADRIVLACTHFLHLRDDIASCSKERAEPVDSRHGVAKRIAEVLESSRLRREDNADPGLPVFLVTGRAPLEERYRLFAGKFGLSSPEILERG